MNWVRGRRGIDRWQEKLRKSSDEGASIEELQSEGEGSCEGRREGGKKI